MTHGTLLFLVVGLYLGALARRPAYGAIAGALIGFIAAGSFYVLAPVTGDWIMFAVWIGAWELLTVLHVRLQSHAHDPAGRSSVRGGIASLACGAAFYAVSGIWFPFNPAGVGLSLALRRVDARVSPRIRGPVPWQHARVLQPLTQETPVKSRREFIGTAAGLGIGLAAGAPEALLAQQPGQSAAPASRTAAGSESHQRADSHASTRATRW